MRFTSRFTQFGAVCISALSIALATGCGDDDSSSPDSEAPGAAGVIITIGPGSMSLGDNAFGQNPREIETGSIVTWVNNDSVAHTVTSSTGIWDSGTIPPGQSFSRMFNDEGAFPYFCELHPGMRGTIRVVTR
jgi:plastocyanin